MKHLVLFTLLFITILASCDQTSEAYVRPYDVIVDTDLGGDPDDVQSLFRLLHYTDILNIKGIVSTPCADSGHHPWDTIPQDKLIREWVMRIDLDHLRSMGYSKLMSESEVLKVIFRGSQDAGLPDPQRTSDGAKHIVRTAKAYSSENPLWILVWGSMTTVAQALHDAPDIAPNIRIYSIGSTNTRVDSLARNYVYSFMENQYPKLWWIENGIMPPASHDTFRGIYMGGDQDGEWGNRAFVEANIKGKGTTRGGTFNEKCGDAFPFATSPPGTLKEGDSPSMLYLISPVVGGIGDPNDPTLESWGGQFRHANPDKYPNYYVDLNLPASKCRATINKWRVDILLDWKTRWEWYDL